MTKISAPFHNHSIGTILRRLYPRSFRMKWIVFLLLVSFLYLSHLSDYYNYYYHSSSSSFLRDKEELNHPNENIIDIPSNGTTLTSGNNSNFVRKLPPALNRKRIRERYIKEKGPLISMLEKQADVTMTPQLVQELPSWSEIVKRYGVGPRLEPNFKEKCQRFRQHLPQSKRFVGVAGMFNTGTNALAYLLEKNTCYFKDHPPKPRALQWQVPWGKHRPASDRHTHVEACCPRVKESQTLAVVMIRDPLIWKHSMCRYSYNLHWKNTPQVRLGYCPSTLRASHPIQFIDGNTFLPINEWDSIFHYWNDWNGLYYHDDDDTNFHIMIRFEDMLFYPERMARLICNCAGGTPQWNATNFELPKDNLKAGDLGHGPQTAKTSNLLKSILKYGKRSYRLQNFTSEDVEFAKRVLDKEIMKTFHYQVEDKI